MCQTGQQTTASIRISVAEGQYDCVGGYQIRRHIGRFGVTRDNHAILEAVVDDILADSACIRLVFVRFAFAADQRQSRAGWQCAHRQQQRIDAFGVCQQPKVRQQHVALQHAKPAPPQVAIVVFGGGWRYIRTNRDKHGIGIPHPLGIIHHRVVVAGIGHHRAVCVFDDFLCVPPAQKTRLGEQVRRQ